MQSGWRCQQHPTLPTLGEKYESTGNPGQAGAQPHAAKRPAEKGKQEQGTGKNKVHGCMAMGWEDVGSENVGVENVGMEPWMEAGRKHPLPTGMTDEQRKEHKRRTKRTDPQREGWAQGTGTSPRWGTGSAPPSRNGVRIIQRPAGKNHQNPEPPAPDQRNARAGWAPLQAD